MIIDDISIKLLDAMHSSIYKPGGLELGFNRNPHKTYADTSTGDHNAFLKLAPTSYIKNTSPNIDSSLWTVAEFMTRIDELTKDKVNQERYMQLQEDKHTRDRQIIEDTRSFLQQDKDDAKTRVEAMEQIAKAKKDYEKLLKLSLQNYDNAKILTVMETKVAKDLRRQVNKAKVKHKRLLEKEKAMGCDQVLVDAYTAGKCRFEIAEETNERLLKKINWYDTELNKFKERMNPSKQSSLSDISDKSFNGNDSESSEMANVTGVSQCVKLHAIRGANNAVVCDIDGMNVKQVPHPPNMSNNAVRSDNHQVPHPPVKNKIGTKRFVRKFNKGIT